MSISGLWLPESAREPKPKSWLCVPCGRRYPLHQKAQFQRHVVECADRNSAAAEAHVERQEASAITSVADKERFAWIRKRAKERGPRPARRRDR